MPGVSLLLLAGSFGLIAQLAAAPVPAGPAAATSAPTAAPPSSAQRRTKDCGQEERDDAGCASGRAIYLVCPAPTPPRFLFCIGGTDPEGRREQ